MVLPAFVLEASTRADPRGRQKLDVVLGHTGRGASPAADESLAIAGGIVRGCRKPTGCRQGDTSVASSRTPRKIEKESMNLLVNTMRMRSAHCDIKRRLEYNWLLLRQKNCSFWLCTFVHSVYLVRSLQPLKATRPQDYEYFQSATGTFKWSTAPDLCEARFRL